MKGEESQSATGSGGRALALKMDDPRELEGDEWDRGWAKSKPFGMQPGFFASDWVKFHRAASWQRALYAETQMDPPQA